MNDDADNNNMSIGAEYILKNIDICSEYSAFKKEIPNKLIDLDYIEVTVFQIKRSRAMLEQVKSEKEACAVQFVELKTLDFTTEDNDLYSKKEAKIDLLGTYISKERAREIVDAGYTNKIDDLIVKSRLRSLPVDIYACGIQGSFIFEPSDGGKLCQGYDLFWPILSNYPGAKWGGCDFTIKQTAKGKSFTFCATSVTGEIFTCVDNGCTDESGKGL